MRALEKGARLITIGCCRTQMARLASLHFESGPGSEGEVIHSLVAAALLQSGRNGSEAGGYTDPRTIKVTAELRQAVAWIAGAKRATFMVPPAIGLRDQFRKSASTLATLAAITGHLNRPGSGVLPLLARSNARGACDMGVAPDWLPGYEPLARGPAQSRLEDLWGRRLPSAPGMDAQTLIQSVSGLIILADDPPSVLPMGQLATSALRKVEFVAVLDAFVTPTVELAHVALPIASFAETEGTITCMEGRVQRLCAATDPPGEARAGWRALAELCARVGPGAFYGSASPIRDEIAQAAPRYAGVAAVLNEGWSETRVSESDGAKPVLQGRATVAPQSDESPYVLAYGDAFDWGRDPLVWFSPTLSRDSRSERRLFPGGFVEISQQDADTVGAHVGRPVRLVSDHGEAVVPIRLRPELKPGVLLVPYSFRGQVESVLGEDGVTAVRVEQI